MQYSGCSAIRTRTWLGCARGCANCSGDPPSRAWGAHEKARARAALAEYSGPFRGSSEVQPEASEDFDPVTYASDVRAEVPDYEELQRVAIAATRAVAIHRMLEL